jgi:hypothetical protein
MRLKQRLDLILSLRGFAGYQPKIKVRSFSSKTSNLGKPSRTQKVTQDFQGEAAPVGHEVIPIGQRLAMPIQNIKRRNRPRRRTVQGVYKAALPHQSAYFL